MLPTVNSNGGTTPKHNCPQRIGLVSALAALTALKHWVKTNLTIGTAIAFGDCMNCIQKLIVAGFTVGLAACTTIQEVPSEEGTDDGGKADDIASTDRFIDKAVASIEQSTVLKSSEMQSGAPGAGPSCALSKGTLLRFTGAVGKTVSGHYAVTLAPGTVVAGCDMSITGRTLFLYAPHVRLIEYREARVATSDGQKLRVLTCRSFSASTTSPAVLLHPAGTSAEETWFASGVFAQLDSAGFCPVAIDWRGHGGSSKPQDPSAYSSARLEKDVVEVLDSLGIARAHFHGYSLGGSILIRALPALAAKGRVLSAAFGGAGLPTGAPDDITGQSKQIAEQIDRDAASTPNPFRTPRDSAAFAALLQKAPWTEPMAPLSFDSFQFRTMGLFGAFDNPVQNTRTFARKMSGRYVGTVSFSNRLHIGTIAPATMPSSYGPSLVSFFGARTPIIPSTDGQLLSPAQIAR
jgi:pimeloyl-ACP methyl ester carboxylesterase